MHDLASLGRILIGIGSIVLIAGLLLLFAPRIPRLQHLGRLPGDLHIERGRIRVYAPIATSIILSILLTVMLNVIFLR